MPSLTFYCQRMAAEIDVHMCSQIIVDTQERAEIGVCLLCEYGATLAEHCPYYARHEALREEARRLGEKLLADGCVCKQPVKDSKTVPTVPANDIEAEKPVEEAPNVPSLQRISESKKQPEAEEQVLTENEDASPQCASDYLAITLSWAIRTYPWAKTHSWPWLISAAVGFGYDGTEKQLREAANEVDLKVITMRNRKALIVDETAKAFVRKASQ